jgi:putative redox protein
MTITVRRDLSQPMRHIVHVRDHQIAVDGSVEEGGSDFGPTPHDLYDAALGACKVAVDRDASQERQGVYRLSTVLHLGGELSEAQRKELLTVAGKCPLHKLMTAVKTEITTTLA